MTSRREELKSIRARCVGDHPFLGFLFPIIKFTLARRRRRSSSLIELSSDSCSRYLGRSEALTERPPTGATSPASNVRVLVSESGTYRLPPGIRTPPPVAILRLPVTRAATWSDIFLSLPVWISAPSL